MRTFQGVRGAFVIGAMVLLTLPAGLSYGQDEPVAVSSTDSEIETTTTTNDAGTGNFSKLPFRVSVSVRGGFDDNVNTSKMNRQESWFTNGSAAITYDFGSPRTQLSLQVGGGVTYYWESRGGINNQDYDVNSYLGLTLKHKASPRLTFDFSAYATYQTQPDFTLALGLNRRSGNYFYTQDKFTTTYLWAPRFATATSYTFSTIRYDDSAIGLFEDRFEHTFGNEFKFLLWPTTSLVAEYRYQIVTYDNEGNVIGPAPTIFGIPIGPAPVLDRDSMTHFVLAGFDHSFGPRFSASLRGGVEFRDYPDAAPGIDERRTSPYFEGTLNYALGKNTSVSWSNRYAIEEGDVLSNSSRTTFRTGLRVKHDFTPRITANLGAYYERDDYDGIDRIGTINDSAAFIENAFDLALSVRYSVTRYFGIEAGYNHTEVWSDIFLREYSRNRYWGGVNLIF